MAYDSRSGSRFAEVFLLGNIESTEEDSERGLVDLHNIYGQWLADQVSRRFRRLDADDLLQDVWVRVAGLHTLSAIRHPKAFLLSIATNVALGRIRHAQVIRRAAAWHTPAVVEPAQDNSVVLRQVVLGLPQPLRDVFVLSRFGGLSNAQIAAQLGIRPKTVEWRMTKALAHCAAQLRR